MQGEDQSLLSQVQRGGESPDYKRIDQDPPFTVLSCPPIPFFILFEDNALAKTESLSAMVKLSQCDQKITSSSLMIRISH